jgi:hypothetical protein
LSGSWINPKRSHIYDTHASHLIPRMPRSSLLGLPHAAILGAAYPNAGQPDIQAIPQAHQAHVDQVKQAPWAQQLLQTHWQGAEFRLVEIRPLLAFQYHVDSDRSNHHCGQLGDPPTLDQLVPLCLPLAWPSEATQSHMLGQPGSQSIIIKSKSLNFRVLDQGVFQQPGVDGAAIGVMIGTAIPIAHVVRFNGRCYLHNGFHRAVGIGQRGATHMPCIFRDVATAEGAGIKANTFQQPLLESANAPTLGHFIDGRAHAVQLRAMTRIVQISWADHVMPDE